MDRYDIHLLASGEEKAKENPFPTNYWILESR